MAGRRPLTPIPPGWFECPCIGTVCEDFPLIPMKVPLGPNYKFPDMFERYTGQHWSPEQALHTAHELVAAVRPGQEICIGMVLDLTNSDKYYDPSFFLERNVRYCKVPCKGRGESPDPLAVNMAVWEIRKTLSEQPHLFILVHCTHGFNRSGFVIVSACMRLLAERGWCVERLLRRFCNQRPPGIYKDQYISDLFKRYNEHRPRVVKTPAVPAWKPEDDPDEGGPAGPYANLPKPQAAAPGHMTHCDKVGDPICMEEARWVLNVVYDALAGQDFWLKNEIVDGYPHYRVQNAAPSKSVVGSQPVSLDRENLEMLRRKRYWVTWKADGTRYMLLLLKFGAYLIDRSGEVRRVQMRFPSRRPTSERKPGTYPLGPPHEYTLLDGEMVVDDVDMETVVQRRRFLIYDVMMLGGEGVCDMRFADRFGLIGKEVIDPRLEEQNYMAKHRNEMFLYDWAWEPFSVRRKDFWPLDKARSLLDKFIPQLCHESDGLILQPYDDPYIPRTYPHLLKWKFPHMNSVDFKLDAKPSRAPVLMLNCGFRRKAGMSDTNHLSLSACGLGDQRVEFPPDVDPLQFDARIIECSFDMERKVWLFMRERTDKDTANHRSVFDKVMTSISDNITQEFLLGVFDEALKLDIYREDQMWKNGTHPTQLAQKERQLRQQQAPQKLPQHEQEQLAQAANGGHEQVQQHHQQQQQQPYHHHPQQHMQEHAAGFGHDDPHLRTAAFSPPADQDYAEGAEDERFYEDDGGMEEDEQQQQEEEEAAYCVTDQ